MSDDAFQSAIMDLRSMEPMSVEGSPLMLNLHRQFSELSCVVPKRSLSLWFYWRSCVFAGMSDNEGIVMDSDGDPASDDLASDSEDDGQDEESGESVQIVSPASPSQVQSVVPALSSEEDEEIEDEDEQESSSASDFEKYITRERATRSARTKQSVRLDKVCSYFQFQ